ncbi:TPM domain-containing protein [Actinoplanes sp. LDG1-01]|uniref:TPM domain-containing protein n=2 Tax=Paractinoplanes lichenicola TaxID=2802976 RepID=A0ABS1VQW5_9ACTN|nr:TPM domain-containing protein [Actinoplanes lichenicola]
MAGPAGAQAPERLATQVTDRAGVLDDRGAVDAALRDLQEKTGLQLFVVLVDSFDGTPAQEWTDETARLSDLGDRDALLAVAVTDRAYAYSFPDDSRLSDSELADVAEQDIEPALSRSDWSAAVIAGAQGYADAASGGGFGWVWLIVVLVVLVALAWWWLRRRRRPAPSAAPQAPAGPSLDELTSQANALLIELDDDLRAGERELGLAAAQYGAEATAPFQAALQASRQDVAEAFRLRMTLEEEPAPDEARRRDTLTKIIELCQGADARLDAESEAFDRLRDLEGRAAEAADEIDRRRAAIEQSLPATEATAQQVLTTYSGGAVTAIATNVDQARERLSFAASALAEAREALADAAGSGAANPGGGVSNPAAGMTGGGAGSSGAAGVPSGGAGSSDAAGAAGGGADPGGDGAGAGPSTTGGAATGAAGSEGGVPGGDRAEAALAVRAAEQAVDQAEQLVAAVSRAAADLPAARSAAEALIAEITGEIAAGRAALSGGGPAPAGLAAAISGGEQALAAAATALAVSRPDPIEAVATLQAADAALDAALAEARDVAERLAHDRGLLAQELPVARAEVAATNDFITTRRGAVDSGARATLSEALRHLATAESVAGTDPATALAEARQARRLAANAGQAARLDVQRWGGGGGSGWGGPGQSGGFDAGAFAGAVLGGILSGGGRSYGGRSGGGFSGGGFGGSGSRGRRTSGGGGGGGGRRGGGGRF